MFLFLFYLVCAKTVCVIRLQILVVQSETVATFHVQKDVRLTSSRRDVALFNLPHSCDDESNKSKYFSAVSFCPCTLFVCILLVMYNGSPCILISVGCNCFGNSLRKELQEK